MPPERHVAVQVPHAPTIELPPPFRLVTLREVGDAVAYARGHAAELGAGTLVSVGRFDVAEFAVVFEPDEPHASSWRVLYAGMVALVRAMASIAPPHKPIAIEWPDAIRVDGGCVGGGGLVAPEDTDAAAPPPWLVFGAVIRLASIPGNDSTAPARGTALEQTALEDEGFDEADASRLVEIFARHLLRVIDRWRDDGFGSVAGEYLSHLAPEDGAQRDIGDDGALLVRRAGRRAERHGLRQRLATAACEAFMARFAQRGAAMRDVRRPVMEAMR
jgi:biotin-(acetyl-CoA carboxylase) ligase